MGLATFIERNMDALLDDWRDFARTQLRQTRVFSEAELENSARKLLQAVANDMRTAQSGNEQKERSRGERSGATPAIRQLGHRHAAVRFEQGLNVDQLAAEYRALRATVLRHWQEELRDGAREVDDVVRFNESIDECLTESMAWYGSRMEEARRLFLAALGHDLRSPLSAVIMSAEAMLRHHELDPRTLRAAEIVRNSGHRMKRMLNDLLDFTSTRLGGRMSIERTDVALQETLKQTVDELSAVHPEVELRFDCRGTLEGHWDPHRLSQVAANLIGNAIQYGEPGKPITVVAEEHPAEVALTVHNEGAPIAVEMRERIFEPFNRGMAREEDQPGGQGSLGLGLYISKQIVEAHGGRIVLDSSAENGTTFCVRLPSAKPAS